MKAALVLVVLAVLTVTNSSVVRVAPRANLNIGFVTTGDRLLYRSYIYQPAIPNSVQLQDVVYRGNITTRISCVQAYEVGGATQWASAYIIQGGIRQANVTVRFTSARGYGYYYLLDIWGR